MKKQERKQMNTRHSETLIRRWRVEAAKRGISLTALVELAMLAFLSGGTK